MKYATLLIDPPWSYATFSPKGNRAADKYATQGDDWVRRLPVPGVAAPDCTLLLWATNPKLDIAFQVIEAYGFTFKSMITWVKMARAACPRIGLGYHARGCTEQLLIATRGNPRAPAPSVRPASVIFCPPGEHSKKPEVQYQIAEGYAPPYLELFHRPRDGGLYGPREGWTFAGNECEGGLDMAEALQRLAVAV